MLKYNLLSPLFFGRKCLVSGAQIVKGLGAEYIRRVKSKHKLNCPQIEMNRKLVYYVIKVLAISSEPSSLTKM